MEFNIKDILLNTGAESAKNVGIQLGRLSSSPTTNTTDDFKNIKSSFTSGFLEGYFRKEDGNINYKILFPIVLIVFILVVLIKKI